MSMKPQDVKNWTSTLQKLQALKPTKLKAETLKDSTLGHKENESTSGPKSLRTWKPKIYEPECPKFLRWKLQKSNESESQKSMRVKPIKSANLQAQKMNLCVRLLEPPMRNRMIKHSVGSLFPTFYLFIVQWFMFQTNTFLPSPCSKCRHKTYVIILPMLSQHIRSPETNMIK